MTEGCWRSSPEIFSSQFTKAEDRERKRKMAREKKGKKERKWKIETVNKQKLFEEKLYIVHTVL